MFRHLEQDQCKYTAASPGDALGWRVAALLLDCAPRMRIAEIIREIGDETAK